MALVDKSLVNGAELSITSSGDMQTTEDNATHLQAAQNRCVARLNTWLEDPTYGSSLHTYLQKGTSPSLVTEQEVRTHIESALQPMIADGRIKDIVSVKIVERTSTDIYVEVVVDIGTQIGTIVFQVNP